MQKLDFKALNDILEICLNIGDKRLIYNMRVAISELERRYHPDWPEELYLNPGVENEIDDIVEKKSRI